jgi:hypothetical protein
VRVLLQACQAYRRKHLNNCLSIAHGKKNKEAEQKILEIIRQEKEQARWRRLNYVMARKKGGSVRRVQVRETDGLIRDEAVTQREVEDAIWDEIHGKRFYLAEQAPIRKGKLRGDFGYMTNTKAAQELLAETYVCPEGTDSGTIYLFEEVAWLRLIIPANLVSTIMRKNGWREGGNIVI